MDPRRDTAHMPCMCDVKPRGSRYACQAPPDARPPLQSRGAGVWTRGQSFGLSSLIESNPWTEAGEG